MRRARIKRDEQAYYHCMTRIVGRQMLLGEAEKEHLHGLIRRVEGFTGVKVLTFALMTNHFHLLLEEPDRNAIVSDEMLLIRMHALYSAEEMEGIEARWSEWDAAGNLLAIEDDKWRYRRRMHDISEFMKTLKHRFSFWYNRIHDRKGTLWSERFKSVLVEGGNALRTVAAYIEMNAVRAGVVADPALYRFCGFGDAAAGAFAARAGITALMVHRGDAYGEATGQDWSVLSVGYLEDVLMYGISAGLLSRCRYFTDGQVVGSRGFVEAFFVANRDYFGPRRKAGGCKVKGEWKGLYAIRDVGRISKKDEGG
ncbi:MAG: transposase [Spartobacteria bacterium]|nr:transposase [Spartobacteria bacterium]